MLDMLDTIQENSIDSITTDPPYELNFMNHNWDNTGIAFQKETWEKCFKVLKSGGHLIAFAGSKGQHRMACAIEDAGFEIRDTIMWLYGCYSSDTQVLTDKGWKYFYDLDKTEKVLQYDKDTNNLSWIKPLNYFEYDIDDRMFKFITEDTEQIITLNHTVIYKLNGVLKSEKAVICFKDFLDMENIVELPIYQNDKVIWQSLNIVDNEFNYKGKVYCLQTETGAFVVRRNNQAFISGNSGFPKSMNIGLAIDKKNGVESKIVGKTKIGKTSLGDSSGWDTSQNMKDIKAVGEYNIKEAQNEFKGWGTQLKPSYEAIILARKPIEKSIVDNVIKYGVGGINIDECRVELESDYEYKETNRKSRQENNVFDNNTCGFDSTNNHTASANINGRFPANTILTYDENDFEEVCGNMPIDKGFKPHKIYSNIENYDGYGNITFKSGQMVGYGDSGSASRYFKNYQYTEDDFYDIPQRYFYCAKASKQDRDEGLDEFEENEIVKTKPRKNNHSTVKPNSLMRYLVRLITPQNGIVLDCFNGSGSTGKAVMLENKEHNKNYKYIGIELNEEYLQISKARIEYQINKK